MCSATNYDVTNKKKVIYPYVPVGVKTTHNSKDVIVNCSIDNCSSDSSISENLLKKLNVRTQTTRLDLAQCKGKMKKKIKVINNLQIFDIDGIEVITLPVVYTKPEASLPFSTEIITQSDLDQFNHPCWYAVPEFTKPLQVIDGTPNEPYAARHMYGWSFDGPIPRISSKSICNHMTVQESNHLNDNRSSFFLKISSNELFRTTMKYF